MKVIIPQVGQSIAEATILKWFKKAGERIEKGESLVEIGTDKINTELPAPVSGTVESLLAAEGETLPVMSEIAIIADEDVDVLHPLNSEVSPDFSGPRTTDPGPSSMPEGYSRIQSSPFVRKLAAEHNIKLEDVAGTGSGGRVTKEDILKVIELRNTQASPEQAVEAAWERVPMSRVRKLIAEHMSLSRKTAADVSTFFEVDMSEVARQRSMARAKLTYLPFVVVAVAKALRDFPVMNSSIEGDDIVYKKDINIGIAVALEDGLIVPVLKRVQEKKLLDVAEALQDLSERARAKHLSVDELEGGTFTITNPGVFGALMGTPIIHQPQVAILGLGAVVKRPVVVSGDAIAVRSMAYLSLSYDHRALDGATADRFLAHIKNTLENQCPSPHE